MRLSQHHSRYPGALMFLHWFMFILIVSMYLIIQVRGYLPKEDGLRTPLILLHKSIGMGILALVICRLVVKWLSPAPPIMPPLNPLSQKLRILGHTALYVVMLLMPISGYLMSITGGKTVLFFGLALPSLIGENKAFSGTLYNTHVLVSQLIYFIVGLHILIALWHHFVRRDNTLIRMMPGKKGV
jgi:cytochrome b561